MAFPRAYDRRLRYSWRTLASWGVLALLILGFLHTGLHAARPSSSFSSSSSVTSAPTSWSTHPITQLMSAAEARFRTKLSKQSTSFSALTAEYTRRYGMPPPKNFEAWYEFAKEYNVVMVDEYDGLMRDLAPFYRMPGEEVRRRIAQIAQLPSIDLVRVRAGVPTTVTLSKGFEDDEVSARAKGFKSMLGKFVKKLPDLDFPINAKAEGRVIIPWEDTVTGNYTNSTTLDTSKSNSPFDPSNYLYKNSSGGLASMLGGAFSSTGEFKADWRAEGNVWDSWRRTCPPNSTARRLFSSIRSGALLGEGGAPPSNNGPRDFTGGAEARASADPEAFSFAPTTSFETLDFCDDPHLHYTQGHFFSDWRTVGALYPVFSPARAAGFSDIKIPSHYYYGSTPAYTYAWDPVNLELKEVDPMEVAWGSETDDDEDESYEDVKEVEDEGDAEFEGAAAKSKSIDRTSNTGTKLPLIFWRGATTGGGNAPPGFAGLYQRHRAVRMASYWAQGNGDVVVGKQTQSSDGELKELSLPLASLNKHIMDLAFVKATNPLQYPGGLEALMRDHRFGDLIPLGGHWRYKYLLDLDGMSYSGRFMSFLASDSVPLKSTVYEEFFADWCEPWLHFIPLSASYSEIYNIYAYFSGIPGQVVSEAVASGALTAKDMKDLGLDAANYDTTNTQSKKGRRKMQGIPGAPDGDARLRRIARAGKQWKKTIGRTLDQEAYVYRLALEWARLVSDDREAMSMKV